jgi:uncharacterized caspase-like protein
MSFKYPITTSLLCLLLASCATGPTVGPNSPLGSGLFSQGGTKKIALVIGNAEYTSLEKLKSSVKDAQDMEEAFEEFTKKLTTSGSKESNVALFYYSGHGADVGGKTYLLATDTPSTIPQDGKLEDQTGVVRLDSLYKEINSLNKAGIKTKNLFVLDNCRDNPLDKYVVVASKDSKGGLRIRNLVNALEGTTTKGMTRDGVVTKGVAWEEDVINPEVFLKPSNSFFGYATTPGDTAKGGKSEGENSPYTKQLLTQIKRRVAVSKLFDDVEKQVKQDTLKSDKEMQNPWHEVSDFGDFYLSPPAFHPDSVIF